MVINLVVVAVFSTLLLIVCNTMIQTIRERNNESAMMKALGFSATRLIQGIYLEALLLIGLGALVGSILASLSLALVGQIFNDFLPGISIKPSHYLTVFAWVNIAAAFCTVFPAVAIKQLVISKTLGDKA
jgi:putative ABC transport system permease protein